MREPTIVKVWRAAAAATVALYFVRASAQGAVSLPLAQIPTTLTTSFQYALGIMFLLGFIWGVVKIWAGADRMSKGDIDGKMGVVSGVIIAGAAAIMGALFYIFGISGGALTPQF